jgi:hypothetical protein
MINDPEPIASVLRSVPGVKDVDIVKFPSGKELWVVLRDPVNVDKLRKASENSGYRVIKHGSLVSKLPRSLAELIWDGLAYVIVKNARNTERQTSAARIMRDLVTGDVIYHIVDSDGMKILQEYLKS